MITKAVLGIDTSNYTTSLAICSLEGEIIENIKIILPVKAGERGLKQSDAVFSHIKNFEVVSNILKKKHEKYDYVAIGYSGYPRDCDGSYMPCFLVGKMVAELISSLYDIPSFAFSHQSGHIQAAMYSAKMPNQNEFIAFHVSGGTTEILHVIPDITGFDINLIGGSVDLHAGQAIDRIGVKMGMQFPCGRELEQCALQNIKIIPKVKICVEGYRCNLSGLENLALSLYEKTDDVCLVSAYTVKFISETIKQLCVNLRKEFNDTCILFAGGVMSNSIIKDELKNTFSNVFFSEPQFSTDNASGIALLALKSFKNKEG